MTSEDWACGDCPRKVEACALCDWFAMSGRIGSSRDTSLADSGEMMLADTLSPEREAP